MKTAVILISGRGSNMEALLRADLPVRFAAVVSSRADAAGLAIAARAGIPTGVVDHTAFPDRESFDAALVREIDRHVPDLVCLAGFMRILSDASVEHYVGRLINIHPSLLPAFPGVHTHARALAEGVKLHGCTVHFVTPRLDHGPIVVQAAVPVFAGDTPATLAARVLVQEHVIYPLAVRWFAEERLTLTPAGNVILAGEAPHGGHLISPVPGTSS